ncbi:DctP family TRAP transporter solute-binding subunit [Sulfurospirillum sp. 1612]|uniref:DctP family TRAP transporter solute-binding subunit n=1 Tax=Sulfurospirillum sp. 1612 TaxID=3094835 RepID=UPI002F9327CC
MMFKIALLISFVCSFLSAAPEYTIRFSHVVSPKTPKGKAALFFKDKLESLTHGKIAVKVYPNSKLFNDSQVLQAMKKGQLEMAVPSLSKLSTLVPQVEIFDLPFLFDNMEHIHRVMRGTVGNTLKQLITNKGFIALDYWDNGFKQLSSSKTPLFSPRDAQHQKFRIMNSEVLKEQFNAVGAQAEVLPFSKVYEALKSHQVDAAENPLSNFYTKKFYEVQNSLVLSSHGYLGYIMLMSKSFWDKLPKNLQKDVKQASDMATQYERKLAKEMESSYLDKLQEYAKTHPNFHILRLNKNERDAWKRDISIIYPKFYPNIGLKLIDEVEKARYQ